MKALIFLAIFASAAPIARAAGDVSVLISCYQQAVAPQRITPNAAAYLCSGAEKETDVPLLLDCYKQAAQAKQITSEAAALLCSKLLK